jgi:hypothetical protein
MDHDSVVNDWRQNAEHNDGENYECLRSMKHREAYTIRPSESEDIAYAEAWRGKRKWRAWC